MFRLEALQAGKGDALLLHWGEPGDPRLIVIDGGPGGTYEESLRPRLEELKAERGLDSRELLPVEILMVSHIDDDHINGVLDLAAELRDQDERDEPLLLDVTTLWHNAFDDLLGNDAEELTAALAASIHGGDVAASSFGPAGTGDHVGVVIASVNQGRKLRQDAEALAWNVNAPFGRLIQTAPTGEPPAHHTLDGGLELTILGPSRERLVELQEKWDEELPKLLEREREAGAAGVARAAARALDESVHNLASLMVLAEADGKTVLLTGDGRGDHLLEGLERTGRIEPGGTLHVDLFKLPHHGSDRNVSTELFRRVTADHYVVSGDGTHHNPEVATLEMISEARRGYDDFTLWLTHREERLERFFEREEAAGRSYRIRFREPDSLSLTVELA